MINKNKKSILIILCVVILAIIVLPHFAIAQEVKLDQGVAIGLIPRSVINNILSWISYMILTFTSNLVTISGTLLSLSIKLTLNIKSIYTGVSSIETLWRTIRDLSSMFIIFILLFESIKMILGMKGVGFSQTVVKIFIAGILINFSLFFCKIIIDASNLVSIQFYNAITPTTSQTLSVQSVFEDGGLSNTFMQSLKIPTIYSTVKFAKGADVSAGIIVATIGGVIMMITASLSFFAASIAFIIRTGLLLFVMTLSPLYFAGMIFPEIKKKVSERILGMLINQCLFMPVYLFLLYIALKIITDSNFMNIFNTTGQAQSSSFGTITIGIAIQYIIALMFINAPLVAAIEFGGMGMKWAPQLDKISKSFGGMLGRNTIGKWSGSLGSKFDNMAAVAQGSKVGRGASTVLRTLGISQAVRGGLSSMEKNKYGSTQSYGDVKKENKDRAKEVAGVQRTRLQNSYLAPGLGSKTPHITPPLLTSEQKKNFVTAVGKMGGKDFENSELETLIDPYFVRHLNSKQVDSILDADYLLPEEKDKFRKARMDNVILTLDSGVLDDIKDVMKGISGKELSKLTTSKYEKGGLVVNGSDVITKDDVIDQLTTSQLQEMRDISGDIKAKIGKRIGGLPAGAKHKASGFIKKNLVEWS